MNSIFRPYPSHPWIADWTFEPRGCNASFRENSPGLFFQARETVGRIAPSMAEPAWILQVPVPQNSGITVLFNGFCAYFTRRKELLGAETIVPEPGVLWGQTAGIPNAILATDQPMEEAEGYQWIDHDDCPALLASRGGTFCLVTKTHLKSEAIRIAEGYLEKNLDRVMEQELAYRKGASNLFEDMAHHDSLAVICAESMMKALRPPEGGIPLSWCQSSTSGTVGLDINELFPLAQAWKLIDPEMAEELVTCALKLQNNAGAIPIFYSPHATHSLMEAPKPLMAKTIESVWEARRDEAFLTTVLPLLRRHIQWMLHHFDPKRKGIHCWKNSAECVVPALYETDLATVDLTVLLLTEIDALNRLRRNCPIYQDDPETFEEERTQLEHNLNEMFWNEPESAFTKAYLRDNETTLRGFPAFMPLLWHGLPVLRKNAMLDRVHESGTLPGGLSVLSWRKSAMDDDSFPILQQLLTFHALKQSDPHGTLMYDFSRITLQGFVEWHTLSLEEDKRLQINPVMAAFIMNVQAIRQYRYHAKGGFTGYMFKLMRKAKADRFDLAVIAATIFTVFSVHTVYTILQAPPPLQMLEAQMNAAYANKDAGQTLRNCMQIIRHYPHDAATARLLAGNISLLQNNLPQAGTLFEDIRKDYPDSPGPMIALGLTYQLLGRFEEAESNYHEFCYIFDEIFPELTGRINHFRQLMQEGFKSPPKWQEIYRYQLMHELE
ncbi:hypothetical protein PDESU_02805 [Pontiella desulfatans]|uniref:Uncharacterized protein n=1 Tax=Pontiella desulfatans TaxID=2750659 RepID=A0A6C2U4C0_PONDE|nr:hypothetical protein [Pontiella desulfatans]VGO14246.1 hypothetical protein PDESU_02805 [Pontiella desulfatans]